MAMKTANDDVYFRIKSAGALKAAGIRLRNPEMEMQGKQAYAEASIENAIRLYSNDLTNEARAALVKLLFDTDPDQDDVTADAEETSAEIEAEAKRLRSANTPYDLVPTSELPPETLYDPDDEYEDDEEDYIDEA